MNKAIMNKKFEKKIYNESWNTPVGIKNMRQMAISLFCDTSLSGVASLKEMVKAAKLRCELQLNIPFDETEFITAVYNILTEYAYTE